MSLDVPSDQFQQWIEQTGRLITDFHQQNSESKVFAGKSPEEVQKLLEKPPIWIAQRADMSAI